MNTISLSSLLLVPDVFSRVVLENLSIRFPQLHVGDNNKIANLLQNVLSSEQGVVHTL